jgi:hypothetical protein
MPPPAAPAYQALPDETLARLPDAKIVVRKNVPELIVNGERGCRSGCS